jgi:hypothetical protein
MFTRRPGLPGKQNSIGTGISAAGSQSLRSCSRRRRFAPDDESSVRYSVFAGDPVYRENKLNRRRAHSRSAPVPAAGALLRMTRGPEDISCSLGDPVYRENKTQSAAGSQSLCSCSRPRRFAPDDDSSVRYSVFAR